jgi:hypothetical protein
MNPKVISFAQAIAKAEGFGPAENLPTRCNNPGDIELGDIGYGIDQGKTIFPSEQDGWTALEEQCELMLTGESHVYSTGMNFLQVAQLYTDGDNPGPWAKIVSRELGISVETTLAEYYNASEQEKI